MASGKTTESDKDCEWLVATCKSRLAEEDISGAKAWIFTARSLFPNNFKVQVVTFEHFKQAVSKILPPVRVSVPSSKLWRDQ